MKFRTSIVTGLRTTATGTPLLRVRATCKAGLVSEAHPTGLIGQLVDDRYLLEEAAWSQVLGPGEGRHQIRGSSAVGCGTTPTP